VSSPVFLCDPCGYLSVEKPGTTEVTGEHGGNPGTRNFRCYPGLQLVHLMPEIPDQEEWLVFRSRYYVFVLLSCFCVFVFSSGAMAQIPKANVFLGYSYARADLNNGNTSNLNGWEGSLEGKFLPFVGIVADLSGEYGSNNFPSSSNQVFQVNAHEHNFLFGPRVSVGIGRVRPFAHALFGAGHVSVSGQGYSASDTAFATALGGGLDFKLIPLVSWRFQGDYLQTRFFGNRQDNGRFSTGIVLNF
jgi:outer membrane protein with beta-barrel domain